MLKLIPFLFSFCAFAQSPDPCAMLPTQVDVQSNAPQASDQAIEMEIINQIGLDVTDRVQILCELRRAMQLQYTPTRSRKIVLRWI
jgi:hypothetical protein